MSAPRRRIARALTVAALAAACSRPAPPRGEEAAEPAEPPVAAAAPVSPSSPAAPGVAADSGAAAADPGGVEAAVAALREYYAAVAAGELERAYTLWGDGGASSGQTLEAFRAGYAETAEVRVEVGEPGRIEGAAGSRYLRLPVEVRATTREGTRQCFRGSYVMRRAVADGASAAQRRWHLDSADLAACPA